VPRIHLRKEIAVTEQQREKAMTIMSRIVILEDKRLPDGSRDVWAAAPSSNGGWYTTHLCGKDKHLSTQWCSCPAGGDCYHARALLLHLIEIGNVLQAIADGTERPTGGWQTFDTCSICEGGPYECECSHNSQPIPRHLDPEYIEYIRDQYADPEV
jgi:hypothetical protein